jgi:hypothetical protein
MAGSLKLLNVDYNTTICGSWMDVAIVVPLVVV